MITANVIQRVFWIRFGSNTGTAFSVDIDARQYLVTAKHLFGDTKAPLSIGIFSNNKWSDCAVKLVGHGTNDIDISVFAANKYLTPPGLPLMANSDGIIYGQDLFFLGFPYGIRGEILLGEKGYPLPLAKRATLSLIDRNSFLLDGHNNPGFSGGPMVFVKQGTGEFRVGGVISGFQAVEEPVLENGQPSGLMYKYNTGIIVCQRIERAVDLVKNNPIGLPLA